MKNNIIFNAMRNIDPKFVEAAAPPHPARFGKGLRIAAIAACLALIIAAGAVGLPFMLRDDDLPPATEPMPGGTGITDTTNEIETVEETTDSFGELPASWVFEVSKPYAVVEIIGVTNGLCMGFRRIKCKVISMSGPGKFNSKSSYIENFEGVYIPGYAVEDFLKNKVVFFELEEIRNHRHDRYAPSHYTIPRFSDGRLIYFPIVDEKLVYEIPENGMDGYYDYPLIHTNEKVYYNLMHQPSYEHLSEIGRKIYDAFPKKRLENGMSLEDLVDYLIRVEKLYEILKEKNTQNSNVPY